MGIKKFIEKIDDYQKRLKQKKAKKIKKSHVEEVIRKLEAKRAELKADIKSAEKRSKKDRLRTKLKVVDKQIERATMLLGKIS